MTTVTDLIICAIDPGLKGAMCFLDPKDRLHPGFLDWPKKWGLKMIFNHLQSYQSSNQLTAFLEEPKSWKGCLARMDDLFCSFGVYRAYLDLLEIPTILVTPTQWQSKIFPKIRGMKPKEKAEFTARAIHPAGFQEKGCFLGPKGAILDGRIDAYLIALSMEGTRCHQRNLM